MIPLLSFFYVFSFVVCYLCIYLVFLCCLCNWPYGCCELNYFFFFLNPGKPLSLCTFLYALYAANRKGQFNTHVKSISHTLLDRHHCLVSTITLQKHFIQNLPSMFKLYLHTKFKTTISSNGKAAWAVLLVALRVAAIPDEATEQSFVFMTLNP